MRYTNLILAAVLVGGTAGGLQAMGADAPSEAKSGDHYQWLEDIHGAKPLEWVKAQNAKSLGLLKSDPRYQTNYDTILAVLNAEDRIPLGNIDHNYVFNFWQDAEHTRGLWRRATIESYNTPTPQWETLIDLDKLAADEKKNWVWKGADCAPSLTHCLIVLSDGGGDSHIVREFDLASKSFMTNGFTLPDAKSDVTYFDDDTVLFGTDFGKGTLTTSGYPNIVKLWRRGQNVADAKTVYEGKLSDVSSAPAVFHGPSGNTALVVRGTSFFEAEYYLVKPDGSTAKLPLSVDADVKGVTQGNLIFTLRKDWNLGGQHFARGALLAMALTPSGAAPQIKTLYVPDARGSIEEVATGRDAVYASIFENVIGSVHAFKLAADGSWSDTKLDLPGAGSTHIVSTNDWGPQAQFSFESFTQPTTLYADNGDGKPAAIKAMPARFDATNIVTDQFEATSKDGTKIPYFVVHQKDATGPRPTILYGYGGFEISMTPSYSANAGKLWVTQGGNYVLANIRGGGEFGPAWHQAALQENRQRAFDDFAAVAADVEKRGLSTPKQLAIMGGSNGGLLVSTVMTQHPELLGAVVCQVPLIDMIRYTHIGAGASWIAEYGDPSKPADRAWIMKYSPYQNVKKGVTYAPVFFVTATSDDRVTPVHARKMAAKMEDQGHDVLFYENTDGGHAASANHKQAAEMWALSYVYLARELGLNSTNAAIPASPLTP
ncbi:MAG TPA: prolyl oligopeptidase family serine peptidase [Rhizomicrobium sp.]|jgi:prolyl oligopeptidase|nr:prolyl oligopeptidase family serine peptidase [Rhizomicrobium sp.]